MAMVSLFGSAAFQDDQLGELRRSRGAWRGTVALDGAAVPLIVSGPRGEPDPDALRLARSVPEQMPAWRPAIERALFEHYAPYAEAIAAGEAGPPEEGLPTIREASSVWPHARIEFVQVAPLAGRLTVEIGLRVAWDEEHTLGARLSGGQLLELNGSVLAP
jgi:hypothetical protein